VFLGFAEQLIKYIARCHVPDGERRRYTAHGRAIPDGEVRHHIQDRHTDRLKIAKQVQELQLLLREDAEGQRIIKAGFDPVFHASPDEIHQRRLNPCQRIEINILVASIRRRPADVVPYQRYFISFGQLDYIAELLAGPIKRDREA